MIKVVSYRACVLVVLVCTSRFDVTRSIQKGFVKMERKESLSYSNISEEIYRTSERSGDIDLVEFFKQLWREKWLVITVVALSTIGAFIYANSQTVTWTTTAKVNQAQDKDLSAFLLEVNRYKAFFEQSSQPNGVRMIRDIDMVIDKETLFKSFIASFNSQSNKLKFIENYDFSDKSIVLNYLAAEPVNKRKKDIYLLRFRSDTKQKSFQVLNEYINFVTKTVSNQALGNLKAIVASRVMELAKEKKVLVSQAKNKLNSELIRIKLAHKVASNAAVINPIKNLDKGNTLFDFQVGTQILDAKLKALNEIKDIEIFEPRLSVVNAMLDTLKSEPVNQDITFQTYHFIIEPVEPMENDNLDRFRIQIMLGFTMGLFVGIVVVLARFIFLR